MAHRGDHRHCGDRLSAQLAVSPLDQGSRLRAHRFRRGKGGNQRRGAGPADRPRGDAGKPERGAHPYRPHPGRGCHYRRPGARRYRGRVLRPSPAAARSGRGGGFDARPAHVGGRPAGGAAFRQVRRRAALRSRGAFARRDARAARGFRRRRCRTRRLRSRPERPRTRIGRDHRSGPDQSRILQSVEPVRRRGPDPADRDHRGAPQAAQRYRTVVHGRDPQPESGSRKADPHAGTGERRRALESAARPRNPARRPARRGRPHPGGP